MEELKFQNRRDFLKKFTLGSAALLSLSSFKFISRTKKRDVTKITVLHTNDMHSHIDPFDKMDKNYPNMGGMIKIAKLIEQIRKKEDNVILLDAGDIFQGTPYFNFFKGEVEFKLMSAMHYDASTMGNHDFDNGIEGFKNMLPHASFPFICSNYDFENTSLKNHTRKFKIFNKAGLKIGVLGIGIQLDGLVPKKLYGNTIYKDPYECANYYADLLRNKYKCDLIICVSHLGYSYSDKDKPSDIKLCKKSKNIDLIIVGHTHTFLDKAVLIKNALGKKIPINQDGWGALNLGRVDFYFSKKNSQQIDLDAHRIRTKNYAKI